MHPPNSLSLLADGERSVVLEGQGLVGQEADRRRQCRRRGDPYHVTPGKYLHLPPAAARAARPPAGRPGIN
jgi:hypothetical protein